MIFAYKGNTSYTPPPTPADVPLCNQNLLDNWYWLNPVNQRGKTTYDPLYNRLPGPDRWFGATPWGNTTASAELTNDGFRLYSKVDKTGEYSAAFGIFQQVVARPIPVGCVVTLSALVSDSQQTDNGLWPNLTATNKNHGGQGRSISITGPGLFTLTYTINKNITGVGVALYRGSTQTNSITISAIKLELGDKSTLASPNNDGEWVLRDPPPDYGLELLKCQRYLQLFSSEAARPTKAVDFRPTMVRKPEFSSIAVNADVLYTAEAELM